MIRCYFGRRGEGKSTMMRHDCRNVARLLIHDPMLQWGEVAHPAPTRDAAFKLIKGKAEFRVALQAHDEASAEWLCDVASATGDCTLALDECDWAFSPNTVPQSVRGVISYSRHYHVDILAGARRPASVPRLLTSQADEIVCFRLTEPRDLDYLTSYCGPEFAARVSRLKRHESACWKVDSDAGPVQDALPMGTP